ncbi:aminopeptidase Q-like [Leptopilina boulardi]|uniref:aminopeptidase Q-like n=1 Tax=Leptopilina boulardi TaxID=63433 RepID=UPI0021F67ABF|nr:aminopeptidase Q-like [Leptopilina boulardi]
MKHIHLSILLFTFVEFTQQSINYRLPNATKPLHYKLKFEPHLSKDNFTFDGEAEILVEILSKTNNITLHSVNLTIFEEETFLIGEEENNNNNNFSQPIEHIYEDESEFFILKFDNQLQPGNYTLMIKFTGAMNDEPRGFFWDSYTNDNNETIYLSATQFETSFARMAFPCWDEPALKSTFEISIKHFSNYTALSNMPMETIISDDDDDDNNEKIWTIFQITPLMSTYLVCFTVTNFVNISHVEGNLTIWSRKDIIDTMNLGLEIASRALTVLEEYTGIPYELPKMDIIAIPNYIHGAMENWGLIVFKEEYLLRNDSSLESDILKTYKFMVHEVAHQWFGNLVTPAWWDDLWITEGLASYLHYFLTDKVFNFPRMMDLFEVSNTFKVYEKDEQLSLPLFRNVTSSRESHNLLLGVHDKSATMMHMLSSLMSKEVFQTGLRKLLQKYRYGTITTDDFWQTLQESLNDSNKIIMNNNFEIKKVMESYISQIGYPVINMSRNYTSGTITLSQECIICPENETESKFWIPINFAKSSSLNFSSTIANYWLSPEEKELIIEGISPDDWIIFNIQNSAYYRVNYDQQNWEIISNFLNSKNFSQIHILNRAQLLDDAFWLFKQNKLDRDFLLNLTLYMAREVDYIPWVACDAILLYFQTQNDTLNFKEYTLNLVEALVEDSGVDQKESDDIFTVFKRFIGTYWSCAADRRYCSKIKW